MKSNMIWAYLIQLGVNMWGQPNSIEKRSLYYDELPTEDDIWKQVVDFLPGQGFNTVVIDVGDGIEYESHPEISTKGAWSKQKLKDELDRMRAMGLNPIPKLNFSTGHDTWLKEYSYLIATPKYYEVCKDIITEVAEVFGNPELFHLGMDEETAGQQIRFNMVRYRQHDLLWHDLYFFFDMCDKVGARPWVWADPVWYNEVEYLKRMPRSVMQSNWYYGFVDKDWQGKYTTRECEAFQTLEKAGFDQIPAGSCWDRNWLNASELMQLAKEEISPEHLKGQFACPWYLTRQIDLYSHLNEAQRFGYALREHYPNG